MANQGDRHVACVDTWLDRAKALPAARLIDTFQESFDALWVRAHRSLGDITLTAIVDRVLCTTAASFPALGSMQTPRGPLLFAEFRARAARLPPQERIDAIRFVLIELLTVLGNLTAEILTPVLHSELSNLALAAGKRATDRGGRRKRIPRSSKTGKP